MNQIEPTLRRKLKVIATVWVLGNSLLWSSSACAEEKKYAELLSAAIEDMAQGSLSAAKADLDAAIAIEPENSSGWYELGILYGKIHDFRNAESAFRHALQLQPDLPKAHYMLGLSLIANPRSQLDWPGAIAEFRAALKIQPDYPDALNYLGVGLTATGQTDLAIATLKNAVRLAPQLSPAHFNLAIALENGGQLDEAVQEYRLAAAAKGGYAEANSALGKLLFRIGKSTEAEQELRRALQLNPDLQDAHYALGRVLNSYKSSEAKIEFNEAIDLGKREPNAIESTQLSNSALDHASKGEMAEAEALLKRAILLRPDYGVPHHNLGLILADRRNLDGAVQQLTLAISLMPGQAKPWFDLGRVQRLQNNSVGALRSLSWARRLAPSDPKIKAELQLLIEEDGGKLQAASQETLKEPQAGALTDSATEHFRFAKELIAAGDSLGAVGELLRSLTILPGSPDPRWSLAVCYEHLGDSDRAILEYHKILLIHPDDVDAYLASGRILMDKGLAADAEGEFRRALARKPDSVAAQKALDQATDALKRP
jgi:Flp pilus assembly protein TadD